MKVNVAGAGAGKTTKMAEHISRFKIPEGKIVFCIAFTNAAANNITEKVEKMLGEVPNNIKISTIHTFLNQELIQPYYYLIYGQHFERISVINLPEKPKYKRSKLSELESVNILHQTQIPEKARFVAYKRSNDKKVNRIIRQKLIGFFAGYCAAIIVDEAQDISEDVKLVLKALDKAGVDIVLYGDPKQDIKGLGQFKKIIDDTKEVSYISESFRCPQKHLNLSNILASEDEKQVAARNTEGSIKIVYESDIEDVHSFIDSGDYGLKYISMKRNRFETHKRKDIESRFETLRHEVHRAMTDKWDGQIHDLEINRGAFYITEVMIEAFDSGQNASDIISGWVGRHAFDRLSDKRFAQMASCFIPKETENEDKPVVQSIESIKGLEAERCLFILTTDLAPYLFQYRTEDNKTSHLLYVALTRSLDQLTILITNEVEQAYSRQFINKYLEDYCGNDIHKKSV